MKQYCFSYLCICYAWTGSQLLPIVLQQCKWMTFIGCSAWRELEWIYFKYLHWRTGLMMRKTAVRPVNHSPWLSCLTLPCCTDITQTTQLATSSCQVWALQRRGCCQLHRNRCTLLGYSIACVAFFRSFHSAVPECKLPLSWCQSYNRSSEIWP